MTCAVCYRQARGFGAYNPRLKRGDPNRHPHRWVFCSRRCQVAFTQILDKTEGRMIDPTELERAAMEAALTPLGDYVASIGMERPLAVYSRTEVLTLIEVAVTAYQDHYDSTAIDYTSPHTPTDADLVHVITLAHDMGLRVMLKPHLDLADEAVSGLWRGGEQGLEVALQLAGFRIAR